MKALDKPKHITSITNISSNDATFQVTKQESTISCSYNTYDDMNNKFESIINNNKSQNINLNYSYNSITKNEPIKENPQITPLLTSEVSIINKRSQSHKKKRNKNFFNKIKKFFNEEQPINNHSSDGSELENDIEDLSPHTKNVISGLLENNDSYSSNNNFSEYNHNYNYNYNINLNKVKFEEIYNCSNKKIHDKKMDDEIIILEDCLKYFDDCGDFDINLNNNKLMKNYDSLKSPNNKIEDFYLETDDNKIFNNDYLVNETDIPCLNIENIKSQNNNGKNDFFNFDDCNYNKFNDKAKNIPTIFGRILKQEALDNNKNLNSNSNSNNIISNINEIVDNSKKI